MLEYFNSLTIGYALSSAILETLCSLANYVSLRAWACISATESLD